MLVLILNAQNLFRYNCLKLHFLSFLVPSFQFIPVLNGLNKIIPLIQCEKMQFLEIFSSFEMKLTKRKKFHPFTGSSLTLRSGRAPGRTTGGFKRRSPLLCICIGTACEKQPPFQKNWTNFLKMLVLTLNLRQPLRYNHLKFYFLFLFNTNFSKHFLFFVFI